MGGGVGVTWLEKWHHLWHSWSQTHIPKKEYRKVAFWGREGKGGCCILVCPGSVHSQRSTTFYIQQAALHAWGHSPWQYLLMYITNVFKNLSPRSPKCKLKSATIKLCAFKKVQWPLQYQTCKLKLIPKWLKPSWSDARLCETSLNCQGEI